MCLILFNCGQWFLNVLCRGRGSRALLKWFKQEVLVHDASYHVSVQLEGPEVGILSSCYKLFDSKPISFAFVK